MKNKMDYNFEYVPQDMLEVLKNYESNDEFKEVLYTFGEEEIVKENGKFYLSHTMFPNLKKEISCAEATEAWQSYNMKTRDDVSVNFDFDKTKFKL